MAPGQLGFSTLRAVVSNFLDFRLFLVRWILISGALGFLTACAAPLVALGSSGTAVASSAGTAAIANPGTAASLATTAATGKSPLEHAASAATKKECSFFNVIDSKPICIDVVFPTITDNSQLYWGPADSPKEAGTK